MLKGVVMQGPAWESHEATLQPPCSFSKAVYHMTSDMPGEGKSRKGLNHMTDNMKGQGDMANDLLGKERSPWG